VRNGAGRWVPNDMVSSVYYFGQGHYLNECVIKVDAGYLKVGASKTGVYQYDWVMLDDFRLYYYGNDDPTAIAPTMAVKQPTQQQHFNLSGQQVGDNQKGLQIVRTVREDGTVVAKKLIKK